MSRKQLLGGLALLTLASVWLAPVLAQPQQCMVCDVVVGESACLAADPPELAYRICTAGEICINNQGGIICFESACYQQQLCILYL